MRKKIPLLSKSRFMYGTQCPKRLYFECYNHELADEVTAAQQAIFDTGTNVGELATQLYPGGVMVAEDHLHHPEAVETTARLMADPAVPAIYEAGFLYDDVRVRADILARVSEDTWDLIEVKSTTSTKEEHVQDVAIQLYVLEGSGVSPRRACLCHINNQYVYPGGPYDLNQLFTIDDITVEARALQPEIGPALETMRLPLWEFEPPDIRPGRQCTSPYMCPFYGFCHEGEPEHHVSQLPRAKADLLQALEDAGIEDIRAIPPDFPGLNPLQRRVHDCVVNGSLHLSPDLPRALSQLEYPVHFLDFETFNPALPLYAGTRPYQVIPFQWSAHILEADGTLRHEEFLYDGPDDPREAFARSLLKALGASGAIMVYSAFEAARVRELADHLPDLAADLLALIDRMVDLLLLIREHCYHPDFHGSFSIKAVLPALVPELGYNDLDINEGTLASVAYGEMIRPETAPERRDFIRRSLLAYCERDTEAEVRLFQALKA